MIETKLDHALVIRNTNAFNVIAAQRQQGHGDIIGDGELSLLLDDLVMLLERIGLKSEEVVNGLRGVANTEVDMPAVVLPPVMVYDENGRVAS